MKNVAAREADLGFDVRRAKDVRIDNGAVDVGAKAGQGTEREAANFGPALVPRSPGEPVGNILGENAHRVLARAGNRSVVNALEVKFAP